MTMTYCQVYFKVDSAGLFKIGTMSVRILARTVLTFLMLLALAGIVSWNSSGSRK